LLLGAVAVAMAVLLAPAFTTHGQEPTTPAGTPDAVPAGLPAVSLSGPFGRLDGLPITASSPLPDPAWLRTLDGYGRGATLRIALRDEDLLFYDWRMTAAPVPTAQSGEPLELGGEPASGVELATVEVPPTGVWLVRLDASLVQREVSFENIFASGSWVWRVSVPDRDAPANSDQPYPPVPAVLLAAGTNVIQMELGSGCYVGTCGDIGFLPPDADLPRIDVERGASMVLSLGDGSGLSGWIVSTRPVGGPSDDFELLARDDLGVSRPVALIGSPGPGRWVLEATLSFDLERGSYDAYARVRTR
jgi:hypothetical protein